jgi:hypothetical protein
MKTCDWFQLPLRSWMINRLCWMNDRYARNAIIIPSRLETWWEVLECGGALPPHLPRKYWERAQPPFPV